MGVFVGAFMSRGFLSCHHHAGSRIHKISSTLSKIIGDWGGGGGGTLPPPYIL